MVRRGNNRNSVNGENGINSENGVCEVQLDQCHIALSIGKAIVYKKDPGIPGS